MPEQCAGHEYIVKEIDTYNKNQIEVVKGQHEIRERLTSVESSTKSAHHRLDDLQELTKCVSDLVYQVKRSTEQTTEVLAQLSKHRSELDELKMKSGKSLEDYFRHGMKYLIGAIVAYLFVLATKGV
jgi:soluble cytochrome b562